MWAELEEIDRSENILKASLEPSALKSHTSPKELKGGLA